MHTPKRRRRIVKYVAKKVMKEMLTRGEDYVKRKYGQAVFDKVKTRMPKTKEGVKALIKEYKGEIKGNRGERRADIAELRSKYAENRDHYKQKIEGYKTKYKDPSKRTKAEIKGDITKEIGEFKTRHKDDIQKYRDKYKARKGGKADDQIGIVVGDDGVVRFRGENPGEQQAAAPNKKVHNRSRRHVRGYEYQAQGGRMQDGGPSENGDAASQGYRRRTALNLDNNEELAQGSHHPWAQPTAISSLITGQLTKAQNSYGDYWDEWAKSKTGSVSLNERGSSPYGVDPSYSSGNDLSASQPMGAFGTNSVMEDYGQTEYEEDYGDEEEYDLGEGPDGEQSVAEGTFDGWAKDSSGRIKLKNNSDRDDWYRKDRSDWDRTHTAAEEAYNKRYVESQNSMPDYLRNSPNGKAISKGEANKAYNKVYQREYAEFFNKHNPDGMRELSSDGTTWYTPKPKQPKPTPGNDDGVYDPKDPNYNDLVSGYIKAKKYSELTTTEKNYLIANDKDFASKYKAGYFKKNPDASWKIVEGVTYDSKTNKWKVPPRPSETKPDYDGVVTPPKPNVPGLPNYRDDELGGTLDPSTKPYSSSNPGGYRPGDSNDPSNQYYNPWGRMEGASNNMYGPSSGQMGQATMEAMQLANAYFAPQRVELAYELGDMETDMRRLAVNLGRQTDDPVLQAKLYKEGMRAVRTLDIQQNTFAFQMSEQRRKEEMDNFRFYDQLAQEESRLKLANRQFYDKMELERREYNLQNWAYQQNATGGGGTAPTSDDDEPAAKSEYGSPGGVNKKSNSGIYS